MEIYLVEDENKLKEYQESRGDTSTQEFFVALMKEEGETPMGVVNKLYSSECKCEDDDSCRYHIDASGQTRHWCYIRGERTNIYNCRAAGHHVFLDDGADKPWSEGPCAAEKECQCRGIGMTPGSANSDVNEDNPLFAKEDPQHKRSYYGRGCGKWDKSDDAWEWCYVGWDSACPDRKRDNLGRGEDWPPTLKPQFRSFLACNAVKLQARQMDAVQTCDAVLLGSTIVVTLYVVLALPTFFIFYKFISNEGHAYVKTESQFEVDLSSSEEEEDDFAEGESSVTDKDKEKPSTTDDKKSDEPY